MNRINVITHTAKLAKTTGLLLLTACLFLGRQALAEPAPSGDGHATVGYLKVFSSTQESQWGEGSYYYLHTGYRISDSTGRTVKWVENHDGSTDEDPQQVELAPGAYTIWAQSDKDGFVNVPVVIKATRTAMLNLEQGRVCNRCVVPFAKLAKSAGSQVAGKKSETHFDRACLPSGGHADFF